MRSRPMEKRYDTSPYSGTYLSPPPDTWRRTNSDSALHQSANEACQSASTIPHRRGSDTCRCFMFYLYLLYQIILMSCCIINLSFHLLLQINMEWVIRQMTIEMVIITLLRDRDLPVRCQEYQAFSKFINSILLFGENFFFFISKKSLFNF